MLLTNLINELLTEVECLHSKANYKRCMEGVPSFKKNFEGNQNKGEMLEEIASSLEVIIAKYIKETTAVPTRQVNTLLRNQCIGKPEEMQMSRI